MMAATCGQIRPLLGALVDGELSGADMLRVVGHLDACGTCTLEVDALREVGTLLRGAAAGGEMPPLAGFADGILVRTRAEQDQSWRRMFSRAVEDWHWAIVGVGSVSATSLQTLFVAVVVLFGTGPERSDSLAAVLNEMGRPSTSFVVLDQAEDWEGVAHSANWRGGGRTPPRAAFLGGASEKDLVSKLSELIGRAGPISAAGKMTEGERRYVELLLDQIGGIRRNPSEARLLATVTVSASSP